MSKPSDPKNAHQSDTGKDKAATDKGFWRALNVADQFSDGGSQSDSSQIPAGIDDGVESQSDQTDKPQVIELTEDLSQLSETEQETRRHALLSMLQASEARQQQVQKTRLPTLTPGMDVLIHSGPYKQRKGTVVDADFINSRVLLAIQDESESQWIGFSRISAWSTDKTDHSSNAS